LEDANEEMAKFLGGTNDSSPTDDNQHDTDDNDDDFPPTIPCAGV
jgi:hypothetical protein